MNENNTITTPGERPQATAAQGPSAKRGLPELLAFGLLPALMVAFFVLVIGFVARPPAYVARAAFVVDWNEMASVIGDEDMAKVREMWRENMTARTTALPQADELSDMLDPDGELNADKRAVLTSKVQEWLRITLTSRADDRDRFTVEFRAANPALAEEVVKRVVQAKVSDLNAEAFLGDVFAAALSEKRLDELQRKEAERRRESGDGESLESGFQEIGAGLSLAKNILGMLVRPVKPVEEVRVENHIGGQVVRVLFAGVFIGGITGVGGLGLRKIASAPRKPEAATSAVPPKLPPMSAPPVIARLDMPKPPILPPPLPRA